VESAVSLHLPGRHLEVRSFGCKVVFRPGDQLASAIAVEVHGKEARASGGERQIKRENLSIRCLRYRKGGCKEGKANSRFHQCLDQKSAESLHVVAIADRTNPFGRFDSQLHRDWFTLVGGAKVTGSTR
jgi:hypothetical protein